MKNVENFYEDPVYECIETHTYYDVKFKGETFTLLRETRYDALNSIEYVLYNEDGEVVKGPVAEFIIGRFVA